MTQRTAPTANVPDPAPLDAAKQPPIDRYCDLILTGGVIDGVIYPWAVLELARAYRFKNIGGTSVGALAAAVTAAAEYARRQGFLSGFNDVILAMPRKLAENVKGRTRILTLFQPTRPNRRLFELFLAVAKINTNDVKSHSKVAGETASAQQQGFSFAGLVRRLLEIYSRAALLGLASGLSLALIGVVRLCFSDRPITTIVISAIVYLFLTAAGIVVLVLAFILFELYRDLVNGLMPNGFGICTGGHAPGTPDDEPSLVEWLHKGIQAAARKALDQPLTFKDLWEAPGGPTPAIAPAATRTRSPRSIDLRMVTTNLTHGRPYGLPLEDETSRLFFKVKDLRPFFPQSIINHLMRHSKPYRPAGPEDPPRGRRNRAILELPVAELPIVVAARLSLSLPVLFSAVPLWAIDYSSKRKRRRVRRCRFSDGGICSNFPIHLFDAAIPKWPTFGINLLDRDAFSKDRLIWLPKLHYQGRGDCWNRFDDRGVKMAPLNRLGQFISSIVYSGKDWDDQTAMRMPGVRDRVVRVYLERNKGGLNLEITGDDIMDFARRYGQPAGKALVEKFTDPSDDSKPSAAWNEHRWVRFNTFLVGLRERIASLRSAAESAAYCKPVSQQIADAKRERPLRGSDSSGIPLQRPQAENLAQLLAALESLETAFEQATSPQPYRPEPPPSLHIRPPL